MEAYYPTQYPYSNQHSTSYPYTADYANTANIAAGQTLDLENSAKLRG